MKEISLEKFGLLTKQIGKNCQYFDEISSTNLYLLENCERFSDGTVITAGYQTQGKGRQQREWMGEKETSLLFSVLLKPDLPLELKLKIVFAAACAVKLSIHKLYGITPSVKWPNDIYIEDKKIAGILCQMSGNSVIAGIGVNVNQEELPESIRSIASSLYLISSQKLEIFHVLSVILNYLEKFSLTLEQEGFFPIREEILKNFYLKGKTVSVETGKDIITGMVTGMDEDGHLLLDTGNRVKTIFAGDAHICS